MFPSHDRSAVIKRTWAAYKPIHDLTLMYVSNEKTREKIRNCLARLSVRLVFLAVHDKLEKTLKCEFQLFMERAVGMGLRRTPLVFGGSLWRFVKRVCARANRGSLISMRLIRSYYETKNCWLQLSKNIEAESMEKHKQCMLKSGFISMDAEESIRKAVDYVSPPRS